MPLCRPKSRIAPVEKREAQRAAENIVDAAKNLLARFPLASLAGDPSADISLAGDSRASRQARLGLARLTRGTDRVLLEACRAAALPVSVGAWRFTRLRACPDHLSQAARRSQPLVLKAHPLEFPDAPTLYAGSRHSPFRRLCTLTTLLRHRDRSLADIHERRSGRSLGALSTRGGHPPRR